MKNQVTLPTNFFEQSLPTLPVPSLDHTLCSFTAAVSPVLTPSQLEKTHAELETFRQRHGVHLQDEIIKNAKVNRHTSYIAADTLDKELCDRSPLPKKGSPPYWESAISSETLEEMLFHATSWTRGITAWHRALRNAELRPPVLDCNGFPFPFPDWMVQSLLFAPPKIRCRAFHFLSQGKGKPLGMKDYKQLFNTFRVPGETCDAFQHYGYENHIIVSYRGYLFVVDVADSYGNPLPSPIIYSSLRDIVEMNQKQCTLDVPSLTSLRREEWFKKRIELKRSPQNEHSLKLVESAMFLLCLHDRQVSSRIDKSPTGRWLDKSLIMDVFFDRVELSGLGGVSSGYGLQRLAEDTALFCANQKMADTVHSRIFNSVRQLNWCLSGADKALLERITERGQQGKHTETTLLTVQSRNYMKKGNLEGILHLSTLMAWWKITHQPAMIAELVNLDHFNCGTDDYVFINSSQAMEFLLMLENKKSSKQEKNMKLHQVLKEYVQNKSCTLSGFGFGNHMLALKCMGERLYGRKLDVFRSFAYGLTTQPTITTSIHRSYHLKSRFDGFPGKSFHVSWLISTPESDIISLEVKGVSGLNLLSTSEFALEISRNITVLEEFFLDINEQR